MKILLIGASGKLGKEAYHYFSQKYAVTGTYCSHNYDGLVFLDVTRIDELISFILTQAPDVIIYTAGITDVDKCEEQKELAFRCNAKPLEEIVRYTNIKLIYISTDYVFSGDEGNYCEGSVPSPKNVYGLSKLAGESATLRNVKNAVIRVSGLFSNISTLDTDTRFAEDNRVSSPISFYDVCRAIESVLDTDASGIFHAAGEKPLSRYEFAVINNAITGSCQNVMPCCYETGVKASRPINSSLTCGRLESLGWTRTKSSRIIRNKQLPLLMADCVGVCLTERTWCDLSTEEQNVDNIIRNSPTFNDVIELAKVHFGYAPETVISCLEGIANHYVPNHVFWNRLSELREIFNIAIVNNGLKCIFNCWRIKYQFDSLFNLTLNSEEVGLRKPDTRIFDFVMSEMNSLPNNTYLWDDDEEIVSTAVRLGINGLIFKRMESFPLAEYSSTEMDSHIQRAIHEQSLRRIPYVES
jgi:dTDP-4-dehydrorhamnose reductase